MNAGSNRTHLRGIGLVELMIAIALSIVLSAALVQIFVSSKNSYRLQDAASGLQENGRFAISYLAQDVRMAGFTGCGSLDKIPINNIVSGLPHDSSTPLDPTSVLLDASTMIRGADNIAASDPVFGNGSGGLNAVPATDVLVIRRGVNGGAVLKGNLNVVNANIQITAPNTLGLAAGDVVLISDCANADLFRATNVSSGGGTQTIAHSNAMNTTNNLSKPYQTDAEIIAFQSTTYFVRDTGRTTAQGDPIRALFVAVRGPGQGGVTSLTNYTGELVEGVEDMQLEYGIDTNADGNGVADVAARYDTANNITDWTQVVSVRINLLMQSSSSGATSKSGALAQQYTFNNATTTATDGRLRQVYYTVVGIRNRLL